MIDLSKPLNLFKSDPIVPKVAAIAVAKNADLDAAMARITGAGYSVDKMDDTNADAYIFAQVDGDFTVEAMVKFDDVIALGMTGVTKAMIPYNFESTSFGDVIAQEGFRPGVSMALDMLSNTIYNILDKSESNDDLVAKLDGAIGGFQGYVEHLARSVPASAFTMEVNKAATPAETPAPEVTKDEPAAEEAASGDGGSADAGVDLSAALAPLSAQVAAIFKSVEALVKTQASTQTELTAIAGQVKAVEEVAKSAAQAVDSSIPNGDDGGDKNAVRKSNGEGPGPIPYIDTAFEPTAH